MIKHLTQYEIATRGGFAQPNVSNWLSGRRLPSRRNLIRLATAMDTTPEELASILVQRWYGRQPAD